MIPNFEYPLIRERREEIEREVGAFRLAARIPSNGKPHPGSMRNVRVCLSKRREVKPERA